MPHMMPEYTNESFVEFMDATGDIRMIPVDAGIETAPDESLVTIHRSKWFCRLSAPGYLDCTAWDGPHDTMDEARAHIQDWYEVDATTGEDLNDG